MALAGLSVPVPTLFDADGAVDAHANTEFGRGLVAAGVEHLFVLGTLGEFPSLTDEERGDVLRAYSDALREGADLWVGVGAPATSRAVGFVRAAEEFSPAALLAVPPYFLQPTEAAIADYYRALRAVTKAPLLAYNIPSKVGYALSPELIHRLARAGVLAGVKDTAGAIASVRGFLRRAPRDFAVFPGDDALAAASIRAGARGAVMGTANVVPRLPIQLVKAAISGATELADRLQLQVDALVRVLAQGPFPATGKFLAARLRSAPEGYRPPHGPLTRTERERVLAALAPVEAGLRPYL